MKRIKFILDAYIYFVFMLSCTVLLIGLHSPYGHLDSTDFFFDELIKMVSPHMVFSKFEDSNTVFPVMQEYLWQLKS